jgi:hypothetical protein
MAKYDVVIDRIETEIICENIVKCGIVDYRTVYRIVIGTQPDVGGMTDVLLKPRQGLERTCS